VKVVLFCGGLGTRLREYSGTVPKPMVNIGCRPIIWHLMKYYAHFGHTEFILCLGYQGDLIRQYIANYAHSPTTTDSRPSSSARDIPLYDPDIADWKITFADTGLHANIGQRLCAIRHYLGDDPAFLANYSDALSDLNLPDYLAHVHREDRVASFVCVRPSQSFHTVSIGRDYRVRDIRRASESDLWINGGFFAFKRQIFDFIKDGEDLVEEPFLRLIDSGQLTAFPHLGFWACMDTLKDKQAFDDMDARGDTPWQLWRSPEMRSRNA